jgi:putative acetyltransferase
MEAPKAMTIAIERADAPGVRELLELSDAFHAELYPPEGNYLLSIDELRDATVVVARVDGVAIGMGALVQKDGYAEIKRMFVRPEARGTGTADGILHSLEQVARAAHVDALKLETGPLQPAALAFYERHGYSRMPAFGDYPESEHSVFYGKSLD